MDSAFADIATAAESRSPTTPTGNLRHFASLDARTLDPFDKLPD